MADLADYLDLTVSQARQQFQALLARRPAGGGRQVTFLPAETLLCLAASFLINHRHYGGLRIHLAPPLATAIQADPLARQYYGRPPRRETLLLPDGAQAPARKYLDWHRERIFIT